MKTLSILIVALLLLSFSAPVQAQESTSIAVVDVQKLLTESKAAKDIQKQLKKYREKFMEHLSKEEQALKKTEKDLIEKKADMAPEDFAKERKAFEEKFLETRRFAQKQKRALDEATVKAMANLEAELYKAVQSIADDKGYDLIISRQNVVLGAKALDISEDAMSKLNDAISKIELDVKAE